MPQREQKTPKIIHIVDDEECIRRSLSFMLKRSGYVTMCWADSKQFLEHARRTDEGCILLDVHMPAINGLEVLQALMAAGCTMPVVIMSGQGDIGTAVKAIKAGAIDFIEKPFDHEVLLDLIGRIFVRLDRDREAARNQEDANARIARLSKREQQVLENLAQGLANKAIAYDLGISARTVEVHRANIMMKLRVRSFPEALRIAFVVGLGA